MQETEEAAAEAEAERRRGLHLEGEARVVEAQPPHRRPQVLEVGGIDREQPSRTPPAAPGRKARQHLGGGLLLVGDGVADAGVGHFLDGRGEEADVARTERVHRHHLRGEDAEALDLVGGVGAHHQDALALAHLAVDDAHQDDDAEIGVVPAVDQHRLQRRVDVALRRRQAGDDRLQHVVDAEAGLGRDHHRVGGIEADHLLDLLLDALRLGGGQVDLVEDRHDLVVVVDRLVDVGERLRLDALAGVDDEQRALAGGERARHLIGEVDVARRVHQIEDVGLAVLGRIFEAHRLRLDGDAALALDVHRIEHLILHLAGGEAAGALDEAIGQRRLAMVDVGDDREVADQRLRGTGHGVPDSIRPPARQAAHTLKDAVACHGNGRRRSALNMPQCSVTNS